MVQIGLYFLTVFVDYSSEAFLEPTYNTLLTFGASENESILEGQIWRFVTPLFLHASLVHLFANVISQLVLGFRIEP